MATYSKLQDGSWGIRSATALRPGATVVVTKKDGSTKTEKIARVLWTDGSTAWLYSVVATRGANHSSKAGYRPSLPFVYHIHD